MNEHSKADLEGFAAYLRKHQLDKSCRIRFDVMRVREFLDFGVARQFKQAVRRTGIDKPASLHTLRHSFATELLRQGVNIRVVQDLLGHESVETTMIYMHVLRQSSLEVTSPLDTLPEASAN